MSKDTTKQPKVTTKQPKASTEQAIMEAAEILFIEKGYARTSTTEIAAKAGCNQAMVHYYYRSKQNLFGLVFRKKAGLFLTSMLSISDDVLPFEEKLKKRIETHFQFIKSNRKLPVLFFNEIATNLDLLKELLNNLAALPLPVFTTIQVELDAEFEKGHIRKMDAFTLIYTIVSLNIMAFLTAPLLQLLSNASDEDLDKLLEERKNESIRFIMFSLRP